MNKGIKTNILSVIEILLTSICILLFFNQVGHLLTPAIVRQDHSDWNRYKYSQEPVDILIIGNSHARYGFQPAVIEDLTGMNTEILATGANNLAWTYFGLKEVLMYKIPEIIIIETFVYDVQYRNAAYTPIARTIYGDNFFKALPATMEVMDLEQFWNAYSPIVRYRQNWQKIGKPVSDLIPDPARPRTDGFIYSRNIVKENSFQQYLATLQPERPLPEAYTFYTTQILTLCQEYQIPVIFIKNPTVDSYGIFDTAHYEMITSQGGIFYDLNTLPNYLPLDRIHFMDVTGTPTNSHLNNIGALVNSVHTAELLAKDFGFHIDPSHRNSYVSQFLLNISVDVISTDEVEICVEPYDQANPLTYEFQVKNTETIIERKMEQDHCWRIETFVFEQAETFHFIVKENPFSEFEQAGVYDLH